MLNDKQPATKITNSHYISNPFTVFINSFRALQTNLYTLLLLIAAALATFLLAIIMVIFVAVIAR